MLTCRDFIDFIVDYLTGELARADSEAFKYHLDDCPDCQKYLSSYQASIALSRAAFLNLDAPVPDDVPEELIQAILQVRQQ